MKLISNQVFDEERALYNTCDATLDNCKFDGPKDGESALKECTNIELHNSYMNLRYPLWHSVNVKVSNTVMTEGCRAAVWYTKNISFDKCELMGIKVVRECKNVVVTNSSVNSPEFGWKSSDVTLDNVEINSEYIFLDSKNIKLNDVKFSGKYSFQYVNNLEITDSFLDTKDAFWHASNVVVKDSYVKGEYLGWYSKGLTFINCTIEGTQPLCYCKDLVLINCKMVNTDLSFEYSCVNVEVEGEILSVKNPKSGVIKADKIKEVIYTPDSKYKSSCEIITK